MSAIKGSSTPPGAPRQMPVLSNFKYEYFVAGISGGVVSTLMLHPLDLIKIRFAGALQYHGITGVGFSAEYLLAIHQASSHGNSVSCVSNT